VVEVCELTTEHRCSGRRMRAPPKRERWRLRSRSSRHGQSRGRRPAVSGSGVRHRRRRLIALERLLAAHPRLVRDRIDTVRILPATVLSDSAGRNGTSWNIARLTRAILRRRNASMGSLRQSTTRWSSCAPDASRGGRVQLGSSTSRRRRRRSRGAPFPRPWPTASWPRRCDSALAGAALYGQAATLATLIDLVSISIQPARISSPRETSPRSELGLPQRSGAGGGRRRSARETASTRARRSIGPSISSGPRSPPTFASRWGSDEPRGQLAICGIRGPANDPVLAIKDSSEELNGPYLESSSLAAVRSRDRHARNALLAVLAISE
jgi:hypothetical protein